MTTYNKLACLNAIQFLRNLDHCLVSVTAMQTVTKPFSVSVAPQKHYENPRDPHGLTLNHHAEGVHKDRHGYYAMGLAAESLASALCDKLSITYESKMGRGFQLRTCCDALERFVNVAGE